MALYKLQIKLNHVNMLVLSSQNLLEVQSHGCSACEKALFYAFFHDNNGWHVTAVDLSSVNSLKSTRYVRRWT